MVHWHAPQRDSQSDSALALAKMSQLPRLLEQQKAEMEQSEKEKRDARKRCRETRAKGVVVSKTLLVYLISSATMDSLLAHTDQNLCANWFHFKPKFFYQFSGKNGKL